MGSKKRLRIQSGAKHAQTVFSKTPAAPDRSWHFLAALILWCGSLWAFQFVTLVKFSQSLQVGARFVTFGRLIEYLSNPDSAVHWDAIDSLLAGLLMFIPTYLVYLQIRFQALSKAWGEIRNTTWKKTLFLSFLFATFSRFAVHPGKFPMVVDHAYFLAAADEIWRSFKMGTFGNYSTLFYSGWNTRQYMGNLYAVLGGALEFITGSHTGVKLLLLITGTASGLGMFLWIEKLTKKSYAAFFAGAAFCLNYWHYYQIFAVGQLHMSIVYACMPWPFYFLEAGLAERRSRLRHFLLCSLPLAGIVYTHFVWGAMMWGIFTIYALIRLLGQAGAEKPAALRLFSVSFVFQFLILVGLITAPLVEKKESAAYYTTRTFAAIQANPAMKVRPDVLYQWYNGHWSLGESQKALQGVQSDFFNSYLGLIPLLFSVLALWSFSRKASVDRNALALIMAGLVGSLSLVFFYFDLVEIPGFSVFRIFPDYRYQTFAVFFMSATAAFGVIGWRQWAEGFPKGWRRSLWCVIPLLLLAADVGSTTFQFPFQASDPENGGSLVEAYKAESDVYLEKKENVPYYIFLESPKSGLYSGHMPGWKAIHMGMPSDLGIQPETGPRQSIFGNVFYDWLSTHFKEPHVFPDSFTMSYFYLNNFRDAAIVAKEPHSVDTSLVRMTGYDGYYMYTQFRHRSPVIASSTIQPYAWKAERDPLELGRLYSSMGLDYDNATAAKIFILGNDLQEPPPSTTRPVWALLDYHVYAKKYSYRVHMNTPAYLRLSASFYSFLDVKIDGKKTPFYPGATYEVVLKVPAGEHLVEIEGGWDPYRKVWLYVTWTALILLAFLAVRFPAGLGKFQRS